MTAGAADTGVATMRRLGETLFALRLLEAECIEVQADDALFY